MKKIYCSVGKLYFLYASCNYILNSSQRTFKVQLLCMPLGFEPEILGVQGKNLMLDIVALLIWVMLLLHLQCQSIDRRGGGDSKEQVRDVFSPPPVLEEIPPRRGLLPQVIATDCLICVSLVVSTISQSSRYFPTKSYYFLKCVCFFYLFLSWGWGLYLEEDGISAW